MQADEIRWIQRFSNYKKANAQLEKAVKLSEERPLSEKIIHIYSPLFQLLYQKMESLDT
jgi:hypothetical protein